MSDYLVRTVKATPNVEVRTQTEVAGASGKGRLRYLVLGDRATGKKRTVAADALFVLIGAHPHSDWLSTDIARDAHGFLLTGDEVPAGSPWPLDRRPLSLETSIPGAGRGRHQARIHQARRLRGR